MTGICVIGLYIAYAIPIYLRLTNPDFQPGPWNLKGHHKLVGWTAIDLDRPHHDLVLRTVVLAVLADLGTTRIIADDGAGNCSSGRTTSTSPHR